MDSGGRRQSPSELTLSWQGGRPPLNEMEISHGMGLLPGGMFMNSLMMHRHRLSLQHLLLAGGLALTLGTLGMLMPSRAASALLESVKQNPALAKSLCAQFKQINAAGRSATAPDSIAMVASSQGLSQVDAEVLATYVIGLHCPDVR